MNIYVPIKKFSIVPLALACCVPLLAFAREGDKKMDTSSVMPAQNVKNILMPNLTVNFQLNSTLGSKETAYYSNIVEKILADLPRKIDLQGEEADLLSGSNRYDTLKVIAYLPPTGEEVSDDPLNKITKSFDISFELPREKKLKRLASANSENDLVVVDRKDSYANFMAKVGLIKDGEDISASAMPVAPIIPIEEVKADAGAESVKVVAKKVDKNTATNQVKKPVVPIQTITLKYFDNGTDFVKEQTDDLEKWAKSIKLSATKDLKIITQTAGSPFETWGDVLTVRMKRLEIFLKAHGVDLAKLKVNYIHLKSTGRQSISIGI
ncbi:MAG: hypothetical protein ACI9TY_001615 [Alphaproteobacteria bacterium]|jgi:hypothetical protein